MHRLCARVHQPLRLGCGVPGQPWSSPAGLRACMKTPAAVERGSCRASTTAAIRSCRKAWQEPRPTTVGICGVEEWRGGVKAGRNCVRPFRWPVSEYPAIRSVATPRSSNRTCPFRASGFRSRGFRRSLTSGGRSLGPVVASPSPGADRGARGASPSRPDSALCHSTTDAADAGRGCPPPGKLG